MGSTGLMYEICYGMCEKMKSEPINTIFIVGPTASGKTALSIDVAKQINGEIICADSQTVRRSMSIGTAKPNIVERENIPHHMLDIIDPYDEFTLADFLGLARAKIDEIHSKGKTVIVVGGTGLYIDALYLQYSLPAISVKEIPSTLDVEELQRRVLSQNLPLPVNNKNPRHLINTLKRGGNVGVKGEALSGSVIVGLDIERQKLIDKINLRVEKMFEDGFVEEVVGIIKEYGEPPKEFDAIGYRLVMKYLDGQIDLQKTKELFKIADRQYARRQMSWLRRNKDIQWFHSTDEALSYILSVC